MPTYEYRCSMCGKSYDKTQSIADRNKCPQCPTCSNPTERIIGKVNFARSSVQSEAHFSDITGQVVRNAKDLERQIDQINAEQGTHYVLADPNDPAAHGVTDEGMDETARAKTATGERDKTLWL